MANEALEALRCWIVAERNGRMWNTDITGFYKKAPHHAPALMGKLGRLVKSCPIKFSVEKPDKNGRTLIKAVVSKQEVAEALHRWIAAKHHGEIRMGEIALFYKEYPHMQSTIQKRTFKTFVKDHARFFSRSEDALGDTWIKANVINPVNVRVEKEASTSPSGPAASVNGGGRNLKPEDALYQWLVARPNHSVNVGELGQVFEKHPDAARAIRGKLSAFVALHPTRFRLKKVAGGQFLVAVHSVRKEKQAPPKTAQEHPTTTQELPRKPRSSLLDRKSHEKNKDGIKVLPDPAEVSSTGFIPRVPVELRLINTDTSVKKLITVEVTDPRRRPIQPVQMRLQPPVSAPVSIPPACQLKLELVWKDQCPNGPLQLHNVQICFFFESGVTISRFVALDAGGDGRMAAIVEEARAKKEYFRPKAAEPAIFNMENVAFPPLPFASTVELKVPLGMPPKMPQPFNFHWFYLPLSDATTYFNRFWTLLEMTLDHEKMELALQDLRHAMPIRHGSHFKQFAFKVPGLAEKRPSVMVGDGCLAQLALPQPGRSVGGRVIAATQEEVVIEFYEALSTSHQYNVRFLVHTLPFKMAYNALRHATRSSMVMERLLRPEVEPQRLPPKPFANVQNEFSRLNERQLSATHTILNRMPGRTRGAPFLLFGPPGTGKTTTLVATAMCLLTMFSQTRLLICAGSNSACDVFAQKLERELRAVRCGIKVERFLSAQLARERDTQQTVGDLEVARVIVATCVTAGKLSQLVNNRFSHVFIDEAGQCTETETLIPLVQCGSDAQWILGGDHKQLGPVIRCPEAQNPGGFDISLFERIMLQNSKYDAELHPHYAVMLNKNYRSHESLLKVPSRLFYKNQLEACATNVTSVAKALGRDCAMIVEHVAGKEDREMTSPSWFNLAECCKVLEYVQFIAAHADKINPPLLVDSDVIVIAPYAAHVRKIRLFLARAGLSGVNVGSVETFQGGEARVVIVSTARSSSMLDDYDAEHHLGFLKNAKRFNVAITRARELLVVVGNVNVLREDPHWGELIQEAANQKAIVGL